MSATAVQFNPPVPERPVKEKHRTVRLTQQADKALMDRAAREGKQVGEVIRDALQFYFDNNP